MPEGVFLFLRYGLGIAAGEAIFHGHRFSVATLPGRYRSFFTIAAGGIGLSAEKRHAAFGFFFIRITDHGVSRGGNGLLVALNGTCRAGIVGIGKGADEAISPVEFFRRRHWVPAWFKIVRCLRHISIKRHKGIEDIGAFRNPWGAMMVLFAGAATGLGQQSYCD